MVKEKLWTLMSQNEPSLVHINLVIFSIYFFRYLFGDLVLTILPCFFFYVFFLVFACRY